ncbi:cytochrome c551 [Brevibacillus daliensis]|uniref:cytochrome c551 n=1 Tax=Brevibacillus daliensis TaxID=2892995 RepID=UPI001E37CBA0|nr:cytochrome c [Brevibacillus daliensis]
MKRWASVLMAGMLVVGLTACGGGEKPAEQGSSTGGTVAVGETKYKQSCVGCHGVDLKGATGPSLEKVGATYNKDQIKEIIEKGKGRMPAGMAKGEDVEAIAAWLADKK